jgi:ankyrin repeat protein
MLGNVRLSIVLMISLLPACAHPAQQPCPDLEAVSHLAPVGAPFGMTIMGPPETVKAPESHVAFPDGPLDSVRITLVRGPCYGTCPSYSIELSGNGSASYTGTGFVLVSGHHAFEVPTESVQCLLTHFKEADFWSLADRYVAHVTDLPAYGLTLTIGGHSKTVIDYLGSAVGMPAAVTALEEEIDRIAADRWVRGTSETLPSLQKEGFDFHSEAAATILANSAAMAPDDLVMGLIASGAPVTGKASGSSEDSSSTTVARASRAGRIAVVQALIAKGAFSDGPPDIVETTLRSAAASGNPLMIPEILKYKPNVNAQDQYGDTALIELLGSQPAVADKSKTDIVASARLQLAAGANPNIADKSGITALFFANNADIVKLLIEAGAKVDVRDKYGSSPLLYARSDDVAVALIEAGADTTVKSRFGETVEKRAIERNFSRTIRLLREKNK